MAGVEFEDPIGNMDGSFNVFYSFSYVLAIITYFAVRKNGILPARLIMV